MANKSKKVKDEKEKKEKAKIEVKEEVKEETVEEIEETNEAESLKGENEKLKAELEKKEKEEAKNERKELFKKVWNIFWWTVLIIWMCICVIDFISVHNEKDPHFCFNKQTTVYTSNDESSKEYGTGTVTYCYGPGYKVYRYNRDNFKAIEFSPFWSKDRTANKTEE